MDRLHDSQERAIVLHPGQPPVSVSVIVPFRPDNDMRDEHWQWLHTQWMKYFPDWELVMGLSYEDDGSWVKAIPTQRAINAASGDVLVITDADVWCSTQPLRRAASVVNHRHNSWVVPHNQVRRLNYDSTKEVINGRPFSRGMTLARGAYRGIAGGGLLVLHRTMWNYTGGFDPRFNGWGGEDSSFGRVMDTLVQTHKRYDGVLWHLWHPLQPRINRTTGSRESKELTNTYKAALRQPEKMRSLLKDRPSIPV